MTSTLAEPRNLAGDGLSLKVAYDEWTFIRELLDAPIFS